MTNTEWNIIILYHSNIWANEEASTWLFNLLETTIFSMLSDFIGSLIQDENEEENFKESLEVKDLSG